MNCFCPPSNRIAVMSRYQAIGSLASRVTLWNAGTLARITNRLPGQRRMGTCHLR